MGRIRMRNI